MLLHGVALRNTTLAGVDQVVILDTIDALEDLHKALFSHLDVELRHLGSAIIQGQRRGQIIDLSCSRPLKQVVRPKGYSGESPVSTPLVRFQRLELITKTKYPRRSDHLQPHWQFSIAIALV